MFIISPGAKPQRHVRLIAAALGVFALFIAVGFLCCTAGSGRMSIGTRSFDRRVDSSDDFCRLAECLGLDIDCRNICEEKIIIPESFNEVYKNYDLLQGESGLALDGFKGREAVRYSAQIVNGYYNDEMILTILVCNGQFIGGDVSSRDFYGKQLSLAEAVRCE